MQALSYEVVLGSTLCKLCSTKQYWEVLCASFVVRSNTRKYFVQALWYEVVLEVPCASFVVRSSTGMYLVQALSYEVVLGSTLCKLCCPQ